MNFEDDNELRYEEYETVTSSVVDAQIREMNEYEDNSFDLRKIPVTLILCAANIITFFMGQNVIEPPAYMSGGLNVAHVFANKEYIRLISYMFLHFDLSHIASNMLALFMFGDFIEKKIGQLKLFFIYSVSGVLAGLLSVYINALSGNNNYYSVGASAAVFAIMGGSFVVKYRYDGFGFKKLIKGFIYVAVYAYLSRGENVDNIAHLAGGVMGAVMAFVMLIGKKGSLLDDKFHKTLGIMFTVILCVVGIGGAGIGKDLKSVPDERIDYVKAMTFPGDTNRSYGEVLDTCHSPRWMVFISTDNMDVVEFDGDVFYKGKERRLKVQFVMDESKTWYLSYFGIEDENITYQQFLKLFD